MHKTMFSSTFKKYRLSPSIRKPCIGYFWSVGRDDFLCFLSLFIFLLCCVIEVSGERVRVNLSLCYGGPWSPCSWDHRVDYPAQIFMVSEYDKTRLNSDD